MGVAKPRILAVDDEADMLETYRSILHKKHSVLTADSGEKALKLARKENFDLVLLDIRMPGKDGIDILKEIKALGVGTEVIMVTASKDIASAVEAMRLGAFDYITKPFDVKELQAIIDKAIEKGALVRENLYLKESLKEASSYCDLIGSSPAMKVLYGTIEKVAPADSTILIYGESGTGKELVSRAIHQKSKRSAKPFVAVNCAAIPDNLLESELFGHERGSFTGALERKLGKFELASGGTLFLDEIGCMPVAMQAKLLRALESHTIERVGGEKEIEIDVRIISATNIDFHQHIKEGKFRQDLYYRLNVIPVNLPPLRERKEDIPLLTSYFMDKFNKMLNKKVKGFSVQAMRLLVNYSWPGNVRELQNLVERVVVLSKGEIIDKEELPFMGEERTEPAPGDSSLKELIEHYEKDVIRKILAEKGENTSHAAKALKIPRTSLITRMRVLGLEPPA